MSKIKFRILRKIPQEHSVIVRYYSDLLSEDALASTFKLDEDNNTVIDRDDNGFPKCCRTDYNIGIWNIDITHASANSADFVNYISAHAPFDWFELQHATMNVEIDTTMSLVDSMIGSEFEAIKPIYVAPTISKEDSLTNSQIEELINSMIANATSGSSSA